MDLFVKYLDKDLLVSKNIRIEEIGGKGKGKLNKKKSNANTMVM